ncbi:MULTISPECIES: DEAD/DEAH box helicase [unclassified Brenneria]|uniref:DEAD/DEAH box helicase n=1 Tax=unclassified Brenneria TaxID=2634434 RepID=UPI001552A5B5|nr:AAA domain-containing protein [Brenneria sp. hezel4-2-4]MEE3652643.1 AAA domain-containing protein [Brenneria sp. HEZEL_4_2_4]NPD02601.1 helicase [Brenneria sp. hezel4-2-4]
MTDKQQALRVLKSWHLVEFFQPYDLDKDDKSVRIPRHELIRCGNTLLPWLDSSARHQLKIPAGDVRYILHIGLFDKAEVNRISERIFGRETDPVKLHDLEQRLDLEGTTCFAKLTVDSTGTPNFKKMSVSTLPWALGHLQNGNAHTLSFSAYRHHCMLLDEQLDRMSQRLLSHPDGEKPTLCAGALVELLDTLYQWAGFEPETDFSIQLDWQETTKTHKEITYADSTRLPHPEQHEHHGDHDADSEDQNEIEATADQVLPILNSFYIEDIEHAMACIASDMGGKALLNYLNVGQNAHPDLYTQEGLQCITRHLRPEATPHGRWPAEPSHGMSLMQQFAINTAAMELKDDGLLSVNGPPGTGKTTLLRDLVAHNLVERAKILAGFNNAAEAVDKQGAPVQALSGFEMVVASYNNAAVENISRELPQRKALGENFSHLDYLKPVANQLHAKKKNKKSWKKSKTQAGKEYHYDRFEPLPADERCWGVIAAALGKKKNREDFADRFFFDMQFIKDSEEEAERCAEYDFLNLWRWRKLNQHQTFAQARRSFNDVLQDVSRQQTELQQIAQLSALLTQVSDEKYSFLHQQALTEAEEQHRRITRELRELEQQLSLIDQKLLIEQSKTALLVNKKPGFLARLFQRGRYRAYLADVHRQQSAQLMRQEEHLRVSEAYVQTKNKREAINEDKQKIAAALKKVKTDYQDKVRQLTQLQQRYPGLPVPDRHRRIDDPELQRHAFWQNEQINRKRSELFVAAMNLHQAWLHEALSNNPFRSLVLEMSNFLKNPTNFDRITTRWRILFMMVPVLSTTFASLGRMFSGVSTGELGWLLIDEAGQAIPQAAVGGIWRAKRVLVVGDPLQIEPVFVTPPRLVKHLCEAMLGNDADKWNPGLWSVQQIADRANRYGCWLKVMEKSVWVGIPLWVHRRCIEPMFSLSNNIAYQNRMIHGSNAEAICSRKLNDDFENHWRVSQGYCSIKQHKPELERDTLALIGDLLSAGCRLSSIYIITPFKAVKEELTDAFAAQPIDLFQRAEIAMSAKELAVWRSKHIGTVHTFQGKENDIVILVLGCDPINQGGAIWASSKPNLLNVALTRARKNIFVVGDPNVWQTLPYFRELAGRLPRL